MSGADQACENTDREIWRLVPSSYYSPSIHVTAENGIGINVGGHVIVMPVEVWHEIGLKYAQSIERFTSGAAAPRGDA